MAENFLYTMALLCFPLFVIVYGEINRMNYLGTAFFDCHLWNSKFQMESIRLELASIPAKKEKKMQTNSCLEKPFDACEGNATVQYS